MPHPQRVPRSPMPVHASSATREFYYRPSPIPNVSPAPNARSPIPNACPAPQCPCTPVRPLGNSITGPVLSPTCAALPNTCSPLPNASRPANSHARHFDHSKFYYRSLAHVESHPQRPCTPLRPLGISITGPVPSPTRARPLPNACVRQFPLECPPRHGPSMHQLIALCHCPARYPNVLTTVRHFKTRARTPPNSQTSTHAYSASPLPPPVPPPPPFISPLPWRLTL